ncbi:MAG TPA: DUF1289 domain-containing protein [Burkholderiales bacterium]|nr:DUF1289 domain-containing protein [Burkholderiales bacterium]
MTKAPPSPCNRHCTLNPDTNICMGCYRTLEEILGWAKYKPQEKQAVLDKLPDRRAEHARNRSG